MSEEEELRRRVESLEKQLAVQQRAEPRVLDHRARLARGGAQDDGACGVGRRWGGRGRHGAIRFIGRQFARYGRAHFGVETLTSFNPFSCLLLHRTAPLLKVHTIRAGMKFLPVWVQYFVTFPCNPSNYIS